MSTFTYVAECTKCGAKITTTGITVEGASSCEPHKFGAVGSYKPSIVYPTDPENAWLRTIDQNKKENEAHYAQFDEDCDEITKFKKTAHSEIASMIKLLRERLDDRQDALERELDDAFDERIGMMRDNMKALTDHKQKNEETKDEAEDLLRSDTAVEEREKKIVSGCENVINSTPELRYIPTELRYTFESLERIERMIEGFGTLHTKKTGSGKKCVFDSVRMPGMSRVASITPQKLELDKYVTLNLRSSVFDDETQRVKVSFKVITKGEEPPVDIKENLSIHIFVTEEAHDAKENDVVAIHEETVRLQDCTESRNRYEMFINKEFQPGLAIVYKIRPVFVTPDDSRYENSEGKWSREANVEIPADETDLEFKFSLNGQEKTLTIPEDDSSLKNFESFQKKMLRAFGRKLQNGEQLLLLADDKPLNTDSTLSKYVQPNYVITAMITQPAKAASPKAVSPKAASPKPSNAEGGAEGGGGDDEKKGPKKKISMLAHFGGKKKRVLLKKKENEFTMEALRAQTIAKFQGALKGDFQMKGHNGQILTSWEDVYAIYDEKAKELTITQ
eukprot:CAMPEP_0197025150 /NCGR_PEP_ID=MMETSP1384-20130603/5561_1 /TAXON_ID=29189 /ORGANISM="Ammonia sp." /LENGTH=561 /DNA_ID=CAMNT_0042453643 /DNA_START=51 /DNA_END=1736 /DNA_ORIENTATION=+